MIFCTLLCNVDEGIAQSVQRINLLFAQIVLGHSNIRFYDSSVWCILPCCQSHVRAFGIRTVIDNLCSCLFGYGIVHHILYSLEEQLCFLRILIIVGTTLTVYVCNLLIITSLTDSYLADTVKQIIKIVCSEYILSLQALIIQHKAFGKVFFQDLCCPNLCAAAHNSGYVELAIM